MWNLDQVFDSSFSSSLKKNLLLNIYLFIDKGKEELRKFFYQDKKIYVFLLSSSHAGNGESADMTAKL